MTLLNALLNEFARLINGFHRARGMEKENKLLKKKKMKQEKVVALSGLCTISEVKWRDVWVTKQTLY